MRISSALIWPAAAVVLLSFSFHGAIRLRSTRREIESLARSIADVRQEIADAESDRKNRHRELTVASNQAQRLQGAANQAEVLLVEANPESQWTTPPDGEPRWVPASPYIWLSKETLSGLPLAPILFNDSGELSAQIGGILALDDQQRAQLNAKLARLLADYRAAEAANVKPLTLASLPLEIANSNGPKAGIEISRTPGEGLRYQQSFLAALTESLGEQRSALIAEAAKEWLGKTFNIAEVGPTLWAVARNPNGSFDCVRRSGGVTTQYTGIPKIEAYVPAHFLPFFAEVIGGRPPNEPNP